MANWFKIYETDLDETRLKYALNKLPEVGWVWIGILSECCKHRSDTIRWSDGEIELFGFSDRLKVSIPKVNEAINMLCEIGYIQKLKGALKVLKWNEKQSEYNHRKQRGDYQNRGDSPIVSDKSIKSPLEERRGEERIRDREVQSEIAIAVKSSPRPTLETVKLHATKMGLPDDEAEKFFHFYESNGWRVGKNPMKSWQSAMINWRKNWQSGVYRSNGPKSTGLSDRDLLDEAMR